MGIAVEEKDLYTAAGTFLATVGLVIVVRLVTSVVSRLPARFINLQWHYISLSCLPVCLLVSSSLSNFSSFLVASGAGLAVVSGATTWQRGVTTFLLCFLLSGQCLEQLSHTFDVALPPRSESWASQYRGQVALWPSGLGFGPVHLLVVYNDVILTRRPCDSKAVETAAIQGGAKVQQLGVRRHILVSFGTNTRVHAMEGCPDGGAHDSVLPLHQVSLFGAAGRLEGVTVRCSLSLGSGDTNSSGDVRSRCLVLDPSTVFENVSVELYADRSFLATADISHAENCADALSQLQEFGRRFLVGEIDVLSCLPSNGSHHFSKLVKDTTLVPAVLKGHVPYFFRCVWYLPAAVRNIPETLTFIADHVVIPVVAVAVDKFVTLLCYLLYVCWSLVPDASHILRVMGVFVSGAYCRSLNGGNSTLCLTSGGGYAEDQWYQLGVSFVDYACETVRLVLDTLELVPGLWWALLWSLRVEWDMVLYFLHLLLLFFATLVQCVHWPLLGLYTVVRALWIFVLDYDLSLVGGTLLSPFTYVCGLQRELLVAESQAAWVFLWWTCAGIGQLFTTLSNATLAVWSGALYAISLYVDTTLCTHSFVALIQTCVVLIAVRNELCEIASRDGASYPNFLNWFPGGKYMVMLKSFIKLHSTVFLRYAAAHLGLIFVLIGLSVVGVLSKLYNLTLYIAFPWVSTTVYLEFFTVNPRRSTVIRLCVVKGLLAVLLDRTIGDFAAYFVGEVVYVFGIVFVGAALVLAWQKGLPVLLLRLLLRLPVHGHEVPASFGTTPDTTVKSDVSENGVADYTARDEEAVVQSDFTDVEDAVGQPGSEKSGV